MRYQLRQMRSWRSNHPDRNSLWVCRKDTRRHIYKKEKCETQYKICNITDDVLDLCGICVRIPHADAAVQRFYGRTDRSNKCGKIIFNCSVSDNHRCIFRQVCRAYPVKIYHLSADCCGADVDICFYEYKLSFVQTVILFIGFGATFTCISPLIDSLSIKYMNGGKNINYPICRAAGSCAWAVACVLLGCSVTGMMLTDF